MRYFRLTIAYDGAGLVGWQRQASGVSVQGLLEAAAGELVGHDVAVTGAGRTDAGVHALGQVASVSLDRDIDAATLTRALNFRLPPQVRVVDAVEVDASFHARFDARGKTYRYHVWNGPVVPPTHRAFVWHVPLPELDVEAMNRAAHALEGATISRHFNRSAPSCRRPSGSCSRRRCGPSAPRRTPGSPPGSPHRQAH